MKKNQEYDRFAGLMEKILSVPHSEVKAKLDAEKKAKMRKKTRKTSAQGGIST
jgi:hypothetical protein